MTLPTASAQWYEVQKIGDPAAGTNNFGCRVALDGDQALVGAYLTTVGGVASNGAAYVFGKDVGGTDNWGQTAYLVPSVLAGQYFGQCATMDGEGDTLAVGCYGQNKMFLYDKVAGQWGNAHGSVAGARSETKTISATGGGATFGYAAALDGDTMIAGEFAKTANTGGAYVYERNQGGADNWGETILTLPGTAVAGGYAGIGVDIDGDWATVASWYGEEAYVFNRNQGGAGSWGHVATLTAGAFGVPGERFGVGAKIQGDTIMVTAPWNDVAGVDAGAGYIFNLSGGVWGQGAGVTRTPDAQLLPTDAAAAGGEYGNGGTIYGDVVALGGYKGDKVELFGRDEGGAGNWGSLGVYAGADTVSTDWFALEVDMASETRLIVSAEYFTAHSGAGSAYIFEPGGASLPGDLDGDGFVGGNDLDIVRSFWGQFVTEGNKLHGDPSGDGFVGGADLDEVRAHWGEGTPPAPVDVPEPSILVLLGGLLGLAFWRRNSRGV